jgi:hypothetical protein
MLSRYPKESDRGAGLLKLRLLQTENLIIFPLGNARVYLGSSFSRLLCWQVECPRQGMPLSDHLRSAQVLVANYLARSCLTLHASDVGGVFERHACKQRVSLVCCAHRGIQALTTSLRSISR